jgi:hypothetical protein
LTNFPLLYILDMRCFMPKCPNCGQNTTRTEDWACQWCGYPLTSNSYKKIDKTYRELREERLGEHIEEMEEEAAPPEPVAAPREAELDPAPEPEEEQVAEVEPEPAVSVEPEATVEPEPEPESEAPPEPEQETETPQPVAEPESEAEPAAEDEGKVEQEEETETPPPVQADVEPQPPAVLPSEQEPELELTASELFSAYETEGPEADARFANKVIKVTGMLNRVEIKDNFDIYYMDLTSSEKRFLQSIRCVFDKERADQLSGLDAGQTVTVQGRYDGSIMNISLRDCVLV